MESIKFGRTAYDLPANGVQLNEQGGRVIFLPGTASFVDVEADVKAAGAITVLDSAGEPILMRSDLVYAGRLAKDDNYVVGADTEQGTDITGTVMIAEFKAPDLRAELEAAKAEIAALNETVDMLVIASLEV